MVFDYHPVLIGGNMAKLSEAKRDEVGIRKCRENDRPYYQCQSTNGVTIEITPFKRKACDVCNRSRVNSRVFEVNPVTGHKVCIHQNYGF